MDRSLPAGAGDAARADHAAVARPARGAALGQRVHAALWLPGEPDGSPQRLRPQAVYPVLVFVVLALGVNWPVMSIALRSLTPIWMAVFRLSVAALTLLLVTSSTRRLVRPSRRDYPIVLSVGLVRLALVFTLVFFALEIVPAGRSSILVWTAALWTVPIAVIFVGEHMNRVRWTGLAIGVGGLALVFEPARFDWTDGRVLLGHALLLGAAVAQASVSVHVRHHSWGSTPLALLPWQLLVATVPVLVIALVWEGIPSVEWSLGLAANLAFQGVVVSGVAVWGQLTVLRSHPAISTNVALMAVPVIGLLSSVIILDETLTGGVVAGLALVLVGVATSRVADTQARAVAPVAPGPG
jgi:drug/metabolite transporter (DMT)-like permease